MAILDDKTVLKLPVETKSGTRLGRVVGFDFEAETHLIARWKVRPRGLTSRMLTAPLLIARAQVLSIDDEKMVVDDNIEKEMELAKAKAIGLVSHSNVKA